MNNELSLCGFALFKPENYDFVISKGINENYFFDENAKKIWIAITQVMADESTINDAFVEVYGRCSSIGDMVVSCLTSANSIFNVDYFIQQIILNYEKQKATLAIVSALEEIKISKSESEIESIKSNLLEKFESKTPVQNKFRNKIYSEVCDDLISTIEKNVVNHQAGIETVISTGFKQLDTTFCGFMEGGLYIIAARTSMGKTTFAINLAENVLKAGHGVLFFTNEMSATQIAMKHISLAAQIKSIRMQKGNMSDDDLNRLHFAIKEKYNANFLINEFAGSNFDKFKMQLRHAVRKNNIKVVFHDYIQQMHLESNGYNNNRVAELSKISNEIKSLARELKIVIVCLAQLNRQAEVLNDTDQPSIAHIKDSGAMEQDADCVMIIHRKRSETSGDVEIIVAKNRHSATTSAKSGQIFLKSDLSINKFFE